MNVLFFYLGRKGGGVRFARQIIEELIMYGDTVTVILDSKSSDFKNNLLQFRTDPKLTIFDYRFCSISSNIKLLKLINTKPKNFFQVSINSMMSHRDYFIWSALRIHRIPRVQVIHDSKRHEGDIYPITQEIRFRARTADVIWALSKNVQEQILPHNDKVFLLNFISEKKSINQNSNTSIVLSLGRDKRYQGLERIPNIANLSLLPDALWVSKGRFIRKALGDSQKVIQIDFWIEDFQILDLLNTALFVLLPYYSASQSGILQQCLVNNVPVVIPPIPGLVEFVKDGENGFISTANTDQALAIACNRAFNQLKDPGHKKSLVCYSEFLITTSARDSMHQ